MTAIWTVRRALLVGTALMASTPAWAQNAVVAPGQPSDPAAPQPEDIIVTGSRIERSGFTAPTPVTVLGAEDLAKRGFTNIGQIANSIPAFQATTTPATTSLNSARAGGSYLNLRGLGDNRTLILVDSRRFVPTNTELTVDTNVIPSSLIERIEVVTGGASAAYGSDAVAGVVNIITRRELEGFIGDVQAGISSRGDNETYRGSLAWGTKFGGDRGNLIIAGEAEKNEGIGFQTSRGWASRGFAVVGNPDGATPANLIVSGVQFSLQTLGGLIGRGPLAGTDFGPGGVPRPFVSGPGDGFFQIGGSGAEASDFVSLSVPYERYTAFGKADYDLGGATAFVQASYAHTSGKANVLPASNFGSIVIQQDNAFLDPGLRTRLLAAGATSFNLARFNLDFGLLTSEVRNDTTRVVAGLEGRFAESWKWNVYGQYGHTLSNVDRGNTANVALLNRSVDAVATPGGPACRVNVDADPANNDPACVPVNLFGLGSPTQAALDYFLGTSAFRAELDQYIVAGSATGELFQLGSRAVSVALGAEYRTTDLTGVADPVSQVNGFTFGNPKSIAGSQDVVEGFGEVLIPLLSDLSFAKALDINAAVRVTNYSGSGTVTTWKVGGDWAINDSIRLRATRSRDIRAPNLSELFQTSNTLFATVRDPARGGASTVVTLVTGGNPVLDPEEADTLTAGVVLTPSFVPGLRLSADYYDIKIDGAVAVLSAQEIVDRCQAGVTALCDFITRDAGGVLTGIVRTNVNVAEVTTKGVDFEASYTARLGQGTLNLRGLATYVDELSNRNGAVRVDRSGDVGPDNNGLPHWRFNIGVTYAKGPLTLYVEDRYVGGGKYDNTFTDADINDNSVRAANYVNVSVQYALIDEDRRRLRLFLNVNNLLDEDPPIAPSTFIAPPQTNAVLYDVVGTYITGGVRFGF